MSNPRRCRRRHANIDNHHFGIDRRIVGNVPCVPKQQLQRMAAPWQGHGGFGLACSEIYCYAVGCQRKIYLCLIMSTTRTDGRIACSIAPISFAQRRLVENFDHWETFEDDLQQREEASDESGFRLTSPRSPLVTPAPCAG
jgi:hypothetical protein